MQTPTTVYQYFDKAGSLLYIGVTDRGPRRSHEHAATKSWWWYAAGCTMEHFPTREEALAREAELIGRFRPPFNKQHNPTPIPYRQAGRVVRSPKPVVDHPTTAISPPEYLKPATKSDWYRLPKEERVLALCVACGQRPSGYRGPTCDMCMAGRRAKKAKYALPKTA